MDRQSTMDRQAFLDALAQSVPPLRSVRIGSWPDPVYIRRMTVGEARELAEIQRAEAEEGEADESLSQAKVLALVVRDASGALLFDRHDAGQMAELAARVDGVDARVVQDLLVAINGLNEPGAGSVDDTGN